MNKNKKLNLFSVDEGEKDVDMFDILPNESLQTKFTDTINEQIQAFTEVRPAFRSTQEIEDLDALNSIMNQIVELNQMQTQIEAQDNSPIKSRSRMDSVSMALNDFFIQEFDDFESNLLINDPITENSLMITNPLKIF